MAKHWIHIAKWETNLKCYILFDSSYMIFNKKQKVEMVNKSVVASSLTGEEENWTGMVQGVFVFVFVLVWWNYLLWYWSGGYIRLYIVKKHRLLHHQEWTLFYTI